MAKVSGPLFGLDARGQVGKAIVYSFWRGINYVRQHVVPANPNSDGQKLFRGLITGLTQAWKSEDTIGAVEIDSAYKLAYKEAAKGMAESGINMYVKDAVAKNGGKDYTGPTWVIPTAPGDNQPA